MSGMVVAYWISHNDGVEKGILDGPGQKTPEFALIDLYEVDGVIRTFETREEAKGWLAKRQHNYENGVIEEDE
jgi:hypothetical protein